MGIKMIVTDLDGTLLRRDNTISMNNRSAFQAARDAGVIPVVATGRIDKEGWFAAEAIGAEKYMLSSNGGVVKDYHKQQVIFEAALSEKMIAELSELLRQDDDFFVQAHTIEGCVCEIRTFPNMEHAGWAPAYIDKFQDQQIVVEDMAVYLQVHHLKVFKFVISSTNYKALDEAQKRAGGIDGLTPLRPMDYCLECVPSEVNKALGLRALCRYLNIQETEVMIIGDSENDKELFETDALKIAMGNATERIRQMADWIAPDNDADGVAEAIRKFVL